MKLKRIFFFAGIIVFLVSCKKDKVENTPPENNQPQPTTQLDSFPLTVGHSWKYYTDSKIDSAGIVLLQQYIDSYWNVLSDTVINGINCSKISQLDSNYNGSIHLGHTYYANKPDGFYGIAQENFGTMFQLRTTIASRKEFNFLSVFESKLVSIDSVIVADTALHFMKFPSVTNDIWNSHEFNVPFPGVMKRKWLGSATVTTTAGTFNCMKLQVFFDEDYNNQPDSGSMTIYQYFSTKGLIQEERHDSLDFGNGNNSMLNQITKLVQVNF